MAHQALQGAQARLDQLQRQCDEAFTAYDANPFNDLKKERYEELKSSLHKAEDVVNSLATAAGAASASGRSIVQDTNEEQAFCKVKVNGPLGHFCGNLLIDTGCTMELNLSEHKAFQLGITAETKQTACELGDCSTSGITCRGAALVEVFVKIEGQTAFSHDHQAWLEVWTDDGSLPLSAHHYQRPATGATDAQTLGQMSLAVQEYSPVKSGKDRHGRDLIIGKPGMLKLGLGIDAKTGHLCNVKRRMRK